MAINWENAPEGATHATESRSAIEGFGAWRKFEEGQWYYYKGGQWVWRSNAKDYLQVNPHLQERPAPQEAELPNGLKWPEDKSFQYYNPYAGGFFFNEHGYYFAYNPEPFFPFIGGGSEVWKTRGETIHRYGGKHAPVVEKKVEVPKKKVGWW